LWWQFVECPAQHFIHQLVGLLDVVGRDLDVMQHRAVSAQGFDLALVLMQQGDAVYQVEVFFMVATGAGLVVLKPQLLGVRIDHGQWFEQPLGILVQGDQLVFFHFARQSGQCPALALLAVDGLGLFPAFVDGQDQTAVH
jgi:hypothetical protein